ncbi:hypothetical protein NIES23_57800 (plasmid) [Trichormus variabilis NIES-23]|uniref:Uncharacterized protein n=1 Tax=Trichormus variabilis NIES-23 TaxID=1973479 RepID=A0A1Z4KVQ9_ANAVA|nr:hypothetical protein NIES23_57800 [Trichormus variabilis NIES-23]
MQITVSTLISASRTLVTSSHELGAPYFHILSYYGHAHGKMNYGSKAR